MKEPRRISNAVRPVMIIKFKVENFDERNDLNLWGIKMHTLLIPQGLSKALKGMKALPTINELMEKAHIVLLLCLVNKVLCDIAKEDPTTNLWLK